MSVCERDNLSTQGARWIKFGIEWLHQNCKSVSNVERHRESCLSIGCLYANTITQKGNAIDIWQAKAPLFSDHEAKAEQNKSPLLHRWHPYVASCVPVFHPSR
ncbi:hypothetical protein AVEN_93573-1 [Araneus ventricosus]|uniref:Uncharacterized protein n=1 Tax=Araneus ventricosus TaxID=182803 RepID=A0A4Y2APJ9_ARAVE|nr:hypothetical protein AVEN_93573-1 [Araneus ventricosus]